MRKRLALLLVLLTASTDIAAQDTRSRLEFGASIKRHADSNVGGGGRSSPDGTVRMINNPLIGVVGAASIGERRIHRSAGLGTHRAIRRHRQAACRRRRIEARLD